MATLPDTAANPARELAAIMFSDVVGYTAIMGRDENEALRTLDAHRELLRTLLPKFNGRMSVRSATALSPASIARSMR